MTEAESINYLVKALEGGNGSRFAGKAGINTSSLSKLRNGSFHIARFADRICAAYGNGIRNGWPSILR